MICSVCGSSVDSRSALEIVIYNGITEDVPFLLFLLLIKQLVTFREFVIF